MNYGDCLNKLRNRCLSVSIEQTLSDGTTLEAILPNGVHVQYTAETLELAIRDLWKDGGKTIEELPDLEGSGDMEKDPKATANSSFDAIVHEHIAELDKAVEIANRRVGRNKEFARGHQSHYDYAEGVAAGLQQALDLLNKRVLKALGVKLSGD